MIASSPYPCGYHLKSENADLGIKNSYYAAKQAARKHRAITGDSSFTVLGPKGEQWRSNVSDHMRPGESYCRLEWKVVST